METTYNTDLLLHFKSITESANDAIISIDRSGTIIFWNSKAEKIFGYKSKDAVGKNVEIIIPDHFVPSHRKGMQRVVGGGEHRVIGNAVELMGKHKSGREFPIELSLSTWKSGSEPFFNGIIRDITERKQAEARLLDSEHKFRSIAQTANDAIVAADQNGNILSWNNAAEKIFGYTHAEVEGKSLTIIIPERFRKGHERGIARVVSTGKHKVIGHTVELYGLRKDGSEFPIELSLSTWKTESGQFFNGIIRDITERKQAEARLLDSEHKFRSIAQTANDAIIAADQNGNILSWNDAAEKIFGHTHAEVEGKSLTIIIPERFRKSHERGIARVVSTGKHKVIGNTVELYGIRKDGSEFPIELSLSTWKTESGQFFCGIIRDISQRKAAELALKKSEENLKEKTKRLKKANHEIHVKNEQLEGLSQKLAKYLSREVYHSIFSGQKDVKIESYRKKLTVFFSDIQGFTELSDRVESEVLTSILNSYLNEMSKIAHQHGGTIDKFIGDAIMIFFGDPETKGTKQDAYCCVKMALDMRKQLIMMQKQWELMGIANPLRVRMGINTGYCTVGNFGSDDRMDYTIVGSQVNLASRLESLAETDQILISQDTYSLIRDSIECVKKEEVKVKGIAYPVQTYQVIDFIQNLKRKNEKIHKKLDGFNFLLDLKKMSSLEKEHVREILGEAMRMLDGKKISE